MVQRQGMGAVRLDQFRERGVVAPDAVPAEQQTRKDRSIDLRMITTNLTHGRPYGLPLEDETSRLFFKIRELKPFFPKEVIRHLV